VRSLAFDIETVPDLGGIDYRDYIYLRSRGKRERSEEEFAREFSFNPFTLFVVSVSGTYVGEGIEESFVLYISDMSSEEREEEVFYSEGRSVRVRFIPIRADFVEGKLYELEEVLLRRFWEEVRRADLLVSFNGYSFDGYILKIRSMIHGIEIPGRFLTDRKFHVDILRFLSNGEKEKSYKLDFVCKKFRIHASKDIIDGSKVAQEFYRGNYELIASYNFKDSIALAQLFERLKGYIPEVAVEEEEATERQLSYLIDLIVRTTGVERRIVEEVVAGLMGSEGISKRNAHMLIEVFRRIEDSSP